MTGFSSPVRVFLFDLGNVLIHFDHMIAARKIADRTGVSVERLYDQFFGSDLLIRHDAGKISVREFYEGVRERLQFDIDEPTFFKMWNDIFAPNEKMFALARRILSRFPAYIISNTNRSHFEHCALKFPVLREFTGWILSYEVRALKPDPKIYEAALKRAGTRPEESFYIDDRSDLIAAARKLGFPAHRFVGYDDLVKRLKSEKLLT
ncbi:MAG: hypothetical protein COV76_00940 [Candidatus Omnitrophica bacterium CG11_big_fil_rev_8_21_14_0_20_64_10]|nr:MAG: hypothetical protein COV76_00940 [Candidatus Omnitrophica bacterium CG11_big_fil_rev_8_21_14_0_20_64_10]